MLLLQHYHYLQAGISVHALVDGAYGQAGRGGATPTRQDILYSHTNHHPTTDVYVHSLHGQGDGVTCQPCL